MPTPLPPPPPFKLPRLPLVNSIDEVVDAFQSVIDWSIEANSSIGYFAVLYKRATIAIRQAIEEDKFCDGERMKRFDVTFARRYFAALNAYFHPDDYETPSHVWQIAFDGHEYDEPIMLQQMLTAVTAHVALDHGVAAAAIGGDSMDSLRKDFDLINALLASQVEGVLDVVAQRSPGVQVIRMVIPDESASSTRYSRGSASATSHRRGTSSQPANRRDSQIGQTWSQMARCA